MSVGRGTEFGPHHLPVTVDLGSGGGGESVDKYEATTTGGVLRWRHRQGHGRRPIPHLDAQVAQAVRPKRHSEISAGVHDRVRGQFAGDETCVVADGLKIPVRQRFIDEPPSNPKRSGFGCQLDRGFQQRTVLESRLSPPFPKRRDRETSIAKISLELRAAEDAARVPVRLAAYLSGELRPDAQQYNLIAQALNRIRHPPDGSARSQAWSWPDNEAYCGFRAYLGLARRFVLAFAVGCVLSASTPSSPVRGPSASLSWPGRPLHSVAGATPLSSRSRMGPCQSVEVGPSRVARLRVLGLGVPGSARHVRHALHTGGPGQSSTVGPVLLDTLIGPTGRPR